MTKWAGAISIAGNAYKRNGLKYLLNKGPAFIIDLLVSNVRFIYYKKYFSTRKFRFQSKDYDYYLNPHGQTWRTERCVEIPIVWKIVADYKAKQKEILEVGNVLSGKFIINHDVLDKYELVPNVINEDVTVYRPDKTYDLIVSISTMEHVGWDETPRDPSKFLKAINNLESMLSPEGQIIITIPMGYNDHIVKVITEQDLFDEKYYLKRTSWLSWEESSLNEVKNMDYDYKHFCANAILIAIKHKSNRNRILSFRT